LSINKGAWYKTAVTNYNGGNTEDIILSGQIIDLPVNKVTLGNLALSADFCYTLPPNTYRKGLDFYSAVITTMQAAIFLLNANKSSNPINLVAQ